MASIERPLEGRFNLNNATIAQKGVGGQNGLSGNSFDDAMTIKKALEDQGIEVSIANASLAIKLNKTNSQHALRVLAGFDIKPGDLTTSSSASDIAEALRQESF